MRDGAAFANQVGGYKGLAMSRCQSMGGAEPGRQHHEQPEAVLRIGKQAQQAVVVGRIPGRCRLDRFSFAGRSFSRTSMDNERRRNHAKFVVVSRLSRNTVGSPFAPFWLTRGEDGNLLFGRGAWEVAARYNHLNLDNGPIQGGQTDAYELGVNWYLNANFKIQFEYLHQVRFHKGTGPNGTLPGDIDALGIRTQLMF